MAGRLSALQVLTATILACTACTAARAPAGNRSRRVVGVGPLDASIVIIGEAPGAEEEKAGEPFVGPAGRRLDTWLALAGIDRQTVRIQNALACRPVAPGARGGEKNRPPEISERTACRAHALAQVDLVSPRVIVCVGSHAAAIFKSHTSDLSDLGRVFYAVGFPDARAWRGQLAEVGAIRQTAAPRLVGCYHPSYVMRLERERSIKAEPANAQAISVLRAAKDMSERTGEHHG